jgi:hypothetical protein
MLSIDPFQYQVIISALSSPAILTNDGILNFARAIGLSVSSSGVWSGVNILTDHIQLTGVFGPPPRKAAIREPRRWQWFRQRNGKARPGR